MIISATQYNTFTSCRRKWALERVWRLPKVEETSQAQLFGIVAHEVIANWLKADDNGRRPDGEIHKTFYEGWRTVKEGTIKDDEEAEEIIQLINLGIDSGILLRRPHRLVEHPFTMPVIDGVSVTGFIDLYLPEDSEVQDHKFSKNSRYCLSEEKLAQSPQMLIYAACCLYDRHMSGQEEKPVLVRHNLFIRQPTPRVKTVEAFVDLPAVDEFWAELIHVAKEMQDLRSTLVGSQEYARGDWAFVQGPCSTDTCNAYGGCPFLGICGGRTDLAGYRANVERIIGKQGQKFDQKEVKDMSLFDKMRSRKKLPCKQEEPPVEETCKACSGKGENSKGFPCKACTRNQLDNVVETVKAAPEVTAEVAEEVTTEEEKPKKTRGRPKGTKNRSKKDQVEAQPIPEPDIAPPPAVEMEGPTLYIRCVPAGRAVTCVERVFKEATRLIMSDLGADAPETFWHVDPFRRRDMLTVAADRVEIITDVFVAAPDSTPEMKAFVQGLRQRFENIVEGV